MYVGILISQLLCFVCVLMHIFIYVIHTHILFSVVEVASDKQVDVVPAFISSLGSQLYDTTGDHSDYDFETIIIILQVCTKFMLLLDIHNITINFVSM